MNCCERRELCAGAFLLRLGLGVLMLVAGVNKFMMPGGPAGFYAGMEKMFGQTWLPGLMWRPFGYAIPYVEVIIGVLLILGIARYWVAIVSALYMLGLAVGMMFIPNMTSVVASNYTYFGLFVANIILGPWDCCCVDYLFCRRSDGTDAKSCSCSCP